MIIMISAMATLQIFTFIAFIVMLVFGLRAYVKLEAFEKSTHQIQYVPLDNTNNASEEIGGSQINDEVSKMYKDEENDDFSDTKF